VALFYGLVYGTASPTRLSLIPQLFGMRCIGALMGCTTFAWSIGGIVGPYVAGYIHDSTKGYSLAFIIAGLLFLVGSASVVFWGHHKKVA
jgi:MFS family permease